MALKIGNTVVIDDNRDFSNLSNVTAQYANVTYQLDVPAGTTAQRPVSPDIGTLRYNTTTLKAEVYTGSAWINI